MPDEIVFAGSIPQHYDQGLGPVLFEQYALETANRVPTLTTGAILDLACGTGRVTRHLRQRQMDAVRIVGGDLSEAMLAYAKENGEENVEWTVADAQALPFADNEFDALTCQFGIMFFPDKPGAMKEFARVVKPGGTLVLATWDEMDRVNVIKENFLLLHEIFPEDPPRFLDVPFSMTDPEAMRPIFTDAFDEVNIERVEKAVPIEDIEATARGLVQGNPIFNQIMERDPKAPEKLMSELRQRLEKDPVSRSSAWMITARNR